MTHLLLAGVFDLGGREVVDRPGSGVGVDGFSHLVKLFPGAQPANLLHCRYSISGVLGASLTSASI
jgi:hypothetical protein